MTDRLARVRAWAELSRVSNAPTVVSNVLVGLALGAAAATVRPSAGALAITGAVMGVAALLLYVGGMALNDAADAPIDREVRPGRPVPSGRISRGHAFAFALGCLLVGGVGAVVYRPATAPYVATLIASIVVYDLAHKRVPLAALLMGVCRGFVYLSVAAAVAVEPGPAAWTLAAAMFLYITLVTFGAQVEDAERPGKRRLLLFAAVVPALAPWLVLRGGEPGLVLVTWIAALLWLLFAARHALFRPGRRTLDLRTGVMGMLSGICLIDAHYLALLGEDWLVAGAVACFALTAFGHQRILGS